MTGYPQDNLAGSEISVVICAYNGERWGDLTAAVRSVQAQSRPAAEIVVVIDHNPGLLERARQELPSVTVIENQGPRGLSGARNSGVEAARGEVIAFMDDDALAAPDWLEQLDAGFSDPEVVGVGGAIEPLWKGGRPGWFPEEFDWVVGCTYRGMPEIMSPVRNLIGCNMSFRREVFKTLGGFRLGYGCDETDFCIQIRQRWPEKRLVYNPAARVRHLVPESRSTWDYFRSRCYFEGRSKAVVSWLVGSRDGLASERAYTLRTLPKGFLRGVKETLVDRDPHGINRASAIQAGLLFTTAGYLAGKLSVREAARERGWQPRST